jgi:hypothetical protein
MEIEIILRLSGGRSFAPPVISLLRFAQDMPSKVEIDSRFVKSNILENR